MAACEAALSCMDARGCPGLHVHFLQIKSQACLECRLFAEGLTSLEAALQLDPQHVDCLLLKAKALNVAELII